jgi:SAM-dependent methyltransferase
MNKDLRPEIFQDHLYDFPYHFIPYEDNGVWRITRDLWWGYEYISMLETIVNLVLNCAPKSVLDFGCGDGRVIYELKKRGIDNIVGIDMSKRAISFAQAMVLYEHIEFFQKIEDVREECFDVIVAMEVLEHIPIEYIRGILIELKNVLKNEGSIIISIPTKNIPLPEKHYRHFSIYEIEREISGIFYIESFQFMHKICMLDNIIRRLVINKFVIANWRPWLRLLKHLYKKYVLNAQEFNGARLIVVLRKDVGDVKKRSISLV